jgi:hypothetical protein
MCWLGDLLHRRTGAGFGSAWQITNSSPCGEGGCLRPFSLC